MNSLCSKCGEHPRKKTNPWCVECNKEYERGRWSRKSEKDRTGSYYKKRYGLTIEEVEYQLSVQNNLCATCSKPIHLEHDKEKACVDHNHETGQIRALLCNHCNRALGLVLEDTKTLENMIKYLRYYS